MEANGHNIRITLFLASMLAPRSRRISTALRWPFLIAQKSAVYLQNLGRRTDRSYGMKIYYTVIHSFIHSYIHKYIQINKDIFNLHFSPYRSHKYILFAHDLPELTYYKNSITNVHGVCPIPCECAIRRQL